MIIRSSSPRLLATNCALLLVLLVLTVSSRAWLTWQPQSSNNFETVVASRVATSIATLNFGVFEEPLFDITFNNGRLIIDDTTENSLRRAVSALPKQYSFTVFSRVDYLLTNGWPPQQAEQLVELVDQYWQYNLAVGQIQSRPLPDTRKTEALSADQELEAFSKLKAIRREYFPKETAQLLFQQQELVTEYFLKRKAIKENPNLSHAQQRAELEALQNSIAQ